jgi:hypothetical protein
MRTRAYTLIEILIAFACCALILALLLSAIQKVRETANHTRCWNNMRQVGVAMHGYAEQHGGNLPTIDGAPVPIYVPEFHTFGNRISDIVFVGILAQLEIPLLTHSQYPRNILVYKCPSDPKAEEYKGVGTTHAANAHVFIDSPNLSKSITDGTSNTIMLAENYLSCGPHTRSYISTSAVGPTTFGTRRPTFADGGSILKGENDGGVYPITRQSPRQTLPSIPNLSFQVRPVEWFPGGEFENPRPQNACDGRIPQTAHAAGMSILMFDGSVRTIQAGVSPEAFWSTVTPRGNEAIGIDN